MHKKNVVEARDGALTCIRKWGLSQWCTMDSPEGILLLGEENRVKTHGERGYCNSQAGREIKCKFGA